MEVLSTEGGGDGGDEQQIETAYFCLSLIAIGPRRRQEEERPGEKVVVVCGRSRKKRQA